MRACQKCQTPDPTVQYRERSLPGLRVLCAECNVDVRTSSTRKVAFKPREVEDRYTLLARKHGL
jgi:RNase P subunit RPR2